MRLVVPVLLILTLASLLNACQQEAAEPEPIRPAQIWEVKQQMAEHLDTYSGEIQPRQLVDLAFRVPGKLLGRHVEVGDLVTEDQDLARLDDQDSKLSVSQSESSLQASQMNLLAARDNQTATQGALTSVQNNLLAAQGSLTSARANLSATRAGLESAQAAVDSAKATAASAKAAVGVAKAEMQNAQVEYQRTAQLVQQGFASHTLLDRDNQRLQTAQANLKSIQANAEAAQAQVQAAVAKVKTTQAQVQAAQGEVESASANVGALQGQVKTTQAQIQAAQAQVGMAEAQVGNTRSQVDLVKNQSGYTVLKSTVAGVVTQTHAEVGQVVAAGQPILSVARAGEFEVHIRVGEQAIQNLQLGTPAEVSLWVGSREALAAKVREIAPVADENRTWLVKVALVQPENPELKLGMTATVAFHQALEQAVVWLPASALYQQAQKPAVWVLAANNTVSLKEVQVAGYLDEGMLVQGIETGVKVIAAGVSRLHTGQQVNPVPYNGQMPAVVN
ncbi:RND family efflux transporter, MFP subunit [Thiothrix eikelboomii]|uniref:RND family efflux transporter, MFP subunit n=1 Tax=Thiothrix eikelboomii TaxID=92487 RepID=A0A1T4X516_9GAMM|nr:efflux RND transporter periplasmic adaptor subunit [Thiothrix eikelboomii]SKA84743.1 RND family efflux transporter, MFP subunit [Thiothrix eikelboomii]